MAAPTTRATAGTTDTAARGTGRPPARSIFFINLPIGVAAFTGGVLPSWVGSEGKASYRAERGECCRGEQDVISASTPSTTRSQSRRTLSRVIAVVGGALSTKTSAAAFVPDRVFEPNRFCSRTIRAGWSAGWRCWPCRSRDHRGGQLREYRGM